MPLMKKKSKKAFEHNVKAEMDSGKDQKQALAIAYNTQKQVGKKMAKGGMVEPVEDSPEKPKSIVEAIRRKKKDVEEGEADLQDSANDHLNYEDDLSFEAARKNTYYDLNQLSEQPEDSNESGDKLSDEDEYGSSMIASIMKKMRSKR